MSSIKSIVEIASKKCLADIESLIETSLPQISSELSTCLVSNKTVTNHFVQLHNSLGVFADGMQHEVIDRITKSATARCREYLTGDRARESCIKASLKDFNVKVDVTDSDRQIDSLNATIHVLEHDVDEKDKEISKLQVGIQPICELVRKLRRSCANLHVRAGRPRKSSRADGGAINARGRKETEEKSEGQDLRAPDKQLLPGYHERFSEEGNTALFSDIIRLLACVGVHCWTFCRPFGAISLGPRLRRTRLRSNSTTLSSRKYTKPSSGSGRYCRSLSKTSRISK